MSFSFACEPQSLSSLLSHTAQAQDTARLVLIKGIKWYSDSQRVGPAHEKNACGYLFFVVDMCGLLSMTVVYCTTAITQQLSCPLNTYRPKQKHPINVILLWHTFTSELFWKWAERKITMWKYVSCQCDVIHFLNVKLCLSFYLALSPTGKCPELVFHIFRLSALMKELHSERRKGNRDRAESESL